MANSKTREFKVEDLIPFRSWFDPKKFKHIKAFQHLQEEGSWPKGFIPENVIMHSNWQLDAYVSMAGAWMEHMFFLKKLIKWGR